MSRRLPPRPRAQPPAKYASTYRARPRRSTRESGPGFPSRSPMAERQRTVGGSAMRTPIWCRQTEPTATAPSRSDTPTSAKTTASRWRFAARTPSAGHSPSLSRATSIRRNRLAAVMVLAVGATMSRTMATAPRSNRPPIAGIPRLTMAARRLHSFAEPWSRSSISLRRCPARRLRRPWRRTPGQGDCRSRGRAPARGVCLATTAPRSRVHPCNTPVRPSAESRDLRASASS